MPIKEGTREQSNTETDVSDANVHQKVPLIPPCKMQPLKVTLTLEKQWRMLRLQASFSAVFSYIADF